MPEYEALQVTINTLLAIAAFIVAVWGVRKVYMEAIQPAKDRARRLGSVERRLQNDDKRLKSLEEMTKLTLRAQLALIDAMVSDDVNKLDELKNIQHDIQEYLIEQKAAGA